MQSKVNLRHKLPASRFLVFCFGILLFQWSTTFAQDTQIMNETSTDRNIQTILMHPSGKELTMPVIFFGENDKLTLCFDFVGESGEDFYYSVVACNYNWEPNENPDYLYLDGFNTNLVENKKYSFNTWKYYEHFMTEIPSPDFRFLTSGNYMVKVFRSSDHDDVVLTRKFCLAERKANIKATVKKPDLQNQELQLEIDLEKLKLTNPLGEIKLIVVKNNDWNNQIKIAYQPVLRDSKLYFDLPYQLITGGENEFRYFDIKSTKYISDRLDSIKYISPETHFYIKPDKLNQFTPYFSSTDLNGMFYIDMPEAYNRHIEADYVTVHFILEAPQAFRSEVYIYGALTNWRTDTGNRMDYNEDKRRYEKTLFLKQGYYNYAYAMKDSDTQKISFEQTEGNHSETENEYAVFVYLRTPTSDFDRLVGFQIVNSTGELKDLKFNP